MFITLMCITLVTNFSARLIDLTAQVSPTIDEKKFDDEL